MLDNTSLIAEWGGVGLAEGESSVNFVWMAALAASLSSSPRLESVPAAGLDVLQRREVETSQSGLSTLLRKNWNILHSWEGWSVTPWLRLKVASSADAQAAGALEASLIPFHTFIRPVLTLERGSGLAVASNSLLRNAKASDRSWARSFNYYYDGAYLGAEMGTRWFDLSLNFGVSCAQASQGVRTILQGAFGTDSAQAGPAAKLGVLVRL